MPVVKLFIALSLSCTLAACGPGGDVFDDRSAASGSEGGSIAGGTTPSSRVLRAVAPATFGSDEELLNYAGLVSLIPLASGSGSSSAKRAEYSDGSPSRLYRSSTTAAASEQTTACNSGGSSTDLSNEVRDVDSPYTSSMYDLSRFRADECRNRLGQVELYSDGYFESGEPVDHSETPDSELDYQRWGMEIAAPFVQEFTGYDADGGIEQYFSLTRYHVLHFADDGGGAGRSAQYQLSLFDGENEEDGHLLIRLQLGASPESSDLFAVASRFDPDDETGRRQFASVAGRMGQEIIEPAVPERCQLLAVTVATVEELVAVENDEEGFDFIGGALEVRADDGEVITYEYSEDGVTVRRNNGPPRFYSNADRDAAARECGF